MSVFIPFAPFLKYFLTKVDLFGQLLVASSSEFQLTRDASYHVAAAPPVLLAPPFSLSTVPRASGLLLVRGLSKDTSSRIATHGYN